MMRDQILPQVDDLLEVLFARFAYLYPGLSYTLTYCSWLGSDVIQSS
ncbi:MAG: hypothetical protein MUO84_06345 [Thermoplasmata archaeon]|nr:hypothetical protein [Thermoplasmata archaeon]